MANARIQEYAEKLSDQLIRFTPYALKKTGLVQSQVFLKIEEYLLSCAPFQLSMKRGIFLVVLSAQEITFFQQFQKKLCSVNLTFQESGSQKPLNLLLRGTIDRVSPVKGTPNVCMMDASLKACPSELVEIIGDYITTLEGLKGQYESFNGTTIPVDETTAKLMRFNNYVELLVGTLRARAALAGLSVNSLVLRLHGAPPGLAEGEPCSAKLYFQVYQFTANGRVSALERRPDGQVGVTIAVEFTPELIEIMDDYFLRQSLPEKSKTAVTPT